jgi:hypothetical protein
VHRNSEESFTGIEGSQQKGPDQQFWRSGAVTCGFGRRPSMLDAEEVRGSNPLAPTKTAGQRPFSPVADLILGAEECLSRTCICKAAGQMR